MQPVKSAQDTMRTVAPASVKAARLSVARSHTALFPTRLALARWTSGGNVPHLHGSSHAPLRAAWYARAQRDFQAWLERGGFVQHDDGAALAEPAESDPPA